jgi:hypothetical protein
LKSKRGRSLELAVHHPGGLDWLRLALSYEVNPAGSNARIRQGRKQDKIARVTITDSLSSNFDADFNTFASNLDRLAALSVKVTSTTTQG